MGILLLQCHCRGVELPYQHDEMIDLGPQSVVYAALWKYAVGQPPDTRFEYQQTDDDQYDLPGTCGQDDYSTQYDTDSEEGQDLIDDFAIHDIPFLFPRIPTTSSRDTIA